MKATMLETAGILGAPFVDDNPTRVRRYPKKRYPGRSTAVQEEVKFALYEAISALPPRSKAILALRFGLDGGDEMRLQQIADLVHVSKERVRQIEKKAIAMLRRLLAPEREKTAA